MHLKLELQLDVLKARRLDTSMYSWGMVSVSYAILTSLVSIGRGMSAAAVDAMGIARAA